MDSQDNKKNRFAIGAIIGLAAGAIAGLLLAPKSGRETRRMIEDKSKQLVSELEKDLKSLETEIKSLNIEKLSAKLRKETSEILSEISDVLSDEKTSKDKLAKTIKKAKKVKSEVVDKSAKARNSK